MPKGKPKFDKAELNAGVQRMISARLAEMRGHLPLSKKSKAKLMAGIAAAKAGRVSKVDLKKLSKRARA